MPRPKAEVPIVTKIAQVFEAVGKLQRNGTHPDGWKWTRASDVFEAVRDKLFKKGVLILPNESKPEYVPVATSNGGEQITECRLAVTYVFMDANEKLPPITINGTGRDVEDRAIYKAQTGAQKALLKRFGLMVEEWGDPEFDSQGYDGSEQLHDAPPARMPDSQPVTFKQIRAFNDACAAANKTQEEIIAYLFHQHKATGVKDLKRGKPFTEALKWANSGGAAPAPKLVAAPVQGKLPMPAPPQSPIELRIGNKTVTVEPTTKSYAL